jgi:hypothetical protein
MATTMACHVSHSGASDEKPSSTLGVFRRSKAVTTFEWLRQSLLPQQPNLIPNPLQLINQPIQRLNRKRHVMQMVKGNLSALPTLLISDTKFHAGAVAVGFCVDYF